ncbi:hypothetical protein LUX05_05495 [Streptomyces somaliensis]|nr:hypothetical protein [Streptomyces somaliensis]
MAVETSSLIAVASGPASAQGTYKATALSPSASWNVSPSSGGFSWSYPLRAVPTPGGQAPSLGLGYSSQSADGRTSATNNQGSWIGEGFSYDPGYIERRYKPCSDDGHAGSGEQCWAFENATVLLNGSATQMVKDDKSGKWHLASDEGSKVEKLTNTVNGDNDNEYWRITTSDGTEYHFGLNRLPGWAAGNEETSSTWTVPVFGDDAGEPCHNATFANAHCKQAWRWNLDYVKDTRGNVMSYYYQPETNHYALNGKTDVNGTPYHRGGYLKRIDHGQRDGGVYAEKAPARVVFTTAERCLPTAEFDCAESKRIKANAAHWPDVPVDQECKAATKCTVGQTFWTTKRLTGVTTQMRKDATTYQDVDAWTFTHLFTDNGDDSKTLWLSRIDHEGRAGTTPVKLPSLDLFGEQLANRVDAVGDNIAPFHRFRLAAVLSETGAQLDVNYAPVECAARRAARPGHVDQALLPGEVVPARHARAGHGLVPQVRGRRGRRDRPHRWRRRPRHPLRLLQGQGRLAQGRTRRHHPGEVPDLGRLAGLRQGHRHQRYRRTAEDPRRLHVHAGHGRRQGRLRRHPFGEGDRLHGHRVHGRRGVHRPPAGGRHLRRRQGRRQDRLPALEAPHRNPDTALGHDPRLHRPAPGGPRIHPPVERRMA